MFKRFFSKKKFLEPDEHSLDIFNDDRSFARYYNIHIPKKPILVSVATALALLFFVLVFGATYRVSAGKTELFPAQCLGNWQHAEYASGAPPDTNEAITEENSARFSGEPSQIFCGQFIGALPDGSQIRSVSLRLRWELVGEKTVTTMQEPEETVPEAKEEASSQGEDASAEMPPSPDTVSTEPDATVLQENQPEPDTEKTSAPDDTSPSDVPGDTSSTTGFLIPHIAYAEETDAPAASLEDTSSEPVTFTDEGTAPVSVPDVFFTVRITTDGSTWQDVARINRENFSDPIELPLQTADDLAQVKISIESGDGAATSTVLLDAVELDVAYVAIDPLALEVLKKNTESSDARKFTISNIVSTDALKLSFVTDTDQGESIVIKKNKIGDSVRFYKEDEESFNIASGIGEEPLLMPAYQFTPGHYIVVLSKEPSVCGEVSLEDCRKSAHYVSEASFEIAPTEDSPLEYQEVSVPIPDLLPSTDTSSAETVPTDIPPDISGQPPPEETAPSESEVQGAAQAEQTE